MGSAAEDDFARFVRASSPRLLRAGWLLLGDWPAAEDLVQTALERTWPKWARLPDESRRLAYVHRVMTTSYLRGARRKWTGEISVGELPERPEPDAVDRAVLRECVRAALDRLPPRQRATVVLRYLLDLSEVDTAAALRVSPGAVKSASSRALTSLRADPRVAELLTEGLPQ